MAKDRALWIVATKDEADDYEAACADFLELQRYYPSDYTDRQVVLAYAEQHDIDCADRPMIYEKQELVVYVMKAEDYDGIDDRGFTYHAKRFVVKGELIPEYSIVG